MKEEIIQIENIMQCLSNETLGQVIKKADTPLVLHGQGNLAERLDALKRNYELMCNFMLSGGQDPQRDVYYSNLKRKLYSILADARVAKIVESNSTIKQARSRSTSLSALLPTMLVALERFEGDMAMADLEGDGAERKRKEIRSRQHYFRQEYFNAIISSNQISDTEQAILTDILQSPTIDRTDKDILISALLIALNVQYDNNKYLALLKAFTNCKDEYLHAHLLVALVLSQHEDSLDVFKSTDDELLLALSDKNTRQELLQLQMQMFLCTNVDEVDKTLKSDIIPTIMKHQNPRDMLKDDTVEGSSLDEILRPNTSEESLNELEETIGRMDNMQKKGMDIYFGGFSKMKRDGFFYTLVNWFYPFTSDHPQLSNLPDEVLHGNMMKMIVEGAPLCDSDMYSMALGISQVYNMLPQQLKDAFGSNEVKIRESFDRNTPAYYRRTYLQNLLRFYRLYTSKNDFHNPFAKNDDIIDDNGWLFMSSRLFTDSGLFVDELIDMTKYLFKKGNYDICWQLINRFIDNNTTDDQKTLLTLISALADYERGYFNEALNGLQEVLETEPDNITALKYYVIICLALCMYDDAHDYAKHLNELQPDKEEYLIYYLTVLIGIGKVEEASGEFFRLYYEKPDDITIQRNMAWAYLQMKKPEKAVELFDKLLADGDKEWTTLVNAFYAYAFTGNFIKIKEFYPSFVEVMKEQEVTDKQGWVDILMMEQRLLNMYGYKRTDFEVLIDSVSPHAIEG